MRCQSISLFFLLSHPPIYPSRNELFNHLAILTSTQQVDQPTSYPPFPISSPLIQLNSHPPTQSTNQLLCIFSSHLTILSPIHPFKQPANPSVSHLAIYSPIHPSKQPAIPSVSHLAIFSSNHPFYQPSSHPLILPARQPTFQQPPRGV